jgi:uncharacterized protein YqgC (DUF456 family)
MMIWLLYILLLLVAAGGWLLVLFLMPGLFLMTGAAAAYALVTHGHFIGWRILLVLLGLTVAAEILEGVIGGYAIRRAGGGRGAGTGAFVGAILGGIFLSLIPIPIIGTILGVCLGAFLGAAAMEFLRGSGHRQSLGVGIGAVHGRLGGLFLKLVIGFVLWVMIAICAWP